MSCQFYLELRSKHRGADCTPITTRQIESLIRLAEARARLDLREHITAQVAVMAAARAPGARLDVFFYTHGRRTLKK